MNGKSTKTDACREGSRFAERLPVSLFWKVAQERNFSNKK
ncbi:hypothetical protein CHCC20488_2271 [Bacillus paralicheniformis]|nr:hypothetical protein CHCC14523_2375 [Bacillus paralicheniformis]TWN78824.1 hypothetical protein CHCC20492_1288 [Bacillus paralicheniformis]TWO02115.1 hypothetical protein CHCC20488_2271 [Bacillus paralicheniformis]